MNLKAFVPDPLRPFLRPIIFATVTLIRGMGAWLRFWRSYFAYTAMCRGEVQMRYLLPCPGEEGVMPLEPVYFYQDTWAFELIVKARPTRHVDIGSHHKFVSLLSKILPTETVDVRPWSLVLPSLRFRQGNILALPYENASQISLSSLCVVEHIGLGRYGDPLDPQGSTKALNELKRILAPGGDLYISVPVDDENRTYFNAHRAFSIPAFEGLVEPLEIVSRAFIYENNFGETPRAGFGTACYHLRKLPAV